MFLEHAHLHDWKTMKELRVNQFYIQALHGFFLQQYINKVNN